MESVTPSRSLKFSVKAQLLRLKIDAMEEQGLELRRIERIAAQQGGDSAIKQAARPRTNHL